MTAGMWCDRLASTSTRQPAPGELRTSQMVKHRWLLVLEEAHSSSQKKHFSLHDRPTPPPIRLRLLSKKKLHSFPYNQELLVRQW
jgi:hypothetical protein